MIGVLRGFFLAIALGLASRFVIAIFYQFTRVDWFADPLSAHLKKRFSFNEIHWTLDNPKIFLILVIAPVFETLLVFPYEVKNYYFRGLLYLATFGVGWWAHAVPPNTGFHGAIALVFFLWVYAVLRERGVSVLKAYCFVVAVHFGNNLIPAFTSP